MQRFSFLWVAVAVALIVVLSVGMESRSAGESAAVGLLLLLTVLGSATMLTFAFRERKNLSGRDVVLATAGLGLLPEIAIWILEFRGSNLNIHGTSILGFFCLLLSCWTCGVGLLVGLGIRMLQRARNAEKQTEARELP